MSWLCKSISQHIAIHSLAAWIMRKDWKFFYAISINFSDDEEITHYSVQWMWNENLSNTGFSCRAQYKSRHPLSTSRSLLKHFKLSFASLNKYLLLSPLPVLFVFQRGLGRKIIEGISASLLEALRALGRIYGRCRDVTFILMLKFYRSQHRRFVLIFDLPQIRKGRDSECSK